MFSLSPKPPAAPASAYIKDVNIDTFMVDVIEASRSHPVVVDFWAPWCGPCKQLTPLLEKIVNALNGVVHLVKIDIDQNPEIAQQMGVQSIPAVFAFYQGRPLDGFMGALPEPQLKAFFDKIIKATGATGDDGLNIDSALKQAAAFLEEKNIPAAQSVYAEIMQAAPDNAVASAGLIRCLLDMGENAAAQDMLDHVPPTIAKDKALQSVRTALELIAEAASHGSFDELQAKLQQNPADHQTRFDLAMACYAAGQREQAVDELLEIIRRQRSWNEEAARKQLVKFFEAFGLTDPLTVSARRRLSSLLFA